MKGINYGRFISVYQSQDGGYYICMYYNSNTSHNILDFHNKLLCTIYIYIIFDVCRKLPTSKLTKLDTYPSLLSLWPLGYYHISWRINWLSGPTKIYLTLVLLAFFLRTPSILCMLYVCMLYDVCCCRCRV